ncbi:PadR family transcriptional regulator [Clostridium sp. Ade.TY]|uniref:PadR family transcriptional regulator n=1 Tax=Clostridium sp. Ade.TY TaxID=1391647 RepID=UPI00040BEC38|nr:PadR family transcriptional regulator [Clostridium sp. Ade.TY]
MSKKTQMLKGTLEGCILAIIHKNETYGYEIISKLKEYGFDNASEGTMYPLLLRLEKAGLLTATMRESNVGAKRKYYRLTDSGIDELNNFIENWNELKVNIDNIINSIED